jgi:hypothetical protein
MGGMIGVLLAAGLVGGGCVDRGAGCGCASLGVEVMVTGMYVGVGVEVGVGDCVLVGENVNVGATVADGFAVDVAIKTVTSAGAICFIVPRWNVGVAEPAPVFEIITSGLCSP